MIFSISVHHGPRYLLVSGAGPVIMADLCGACSLAAEVGRRRGHRCVLFDLLAVEPEIQEEDRVELGRHIVGEFAGLDAVAAVVPPSLYNGVAETIAQAAGVRLRVFHQIEDATQWLSRLPPD